MQRTHNPRGLPRCHGRESLDYEDNRARVVAPTARAHGVVAPFGAARVRPEGFPLAQTHPAGPPPLTRSVQHTHKEIQFTPKSSNFAEKKVNYDFRNRALRYDIKYLS